jgi:hypothetical protein
LISKTDPWKTAKYEFPILAAADVKNFPGDEICAITTASERTIIIPPIKKAKINAKKGSKVLLRNFSSNFFIS